MEAVARELVRRDIIPKVAGFRAFDQQVSDELPEPLLRSRHVLASMQECREVRGVILVGYKRVGLEHRREPLASVARTVADRSQMIEMASDLAFVPGDQDRFDV